MLWPGWSFFYFQAVHFNSFGTLKLLPEQKSHGIHSSVQGSLDRKDESTECILRDGGREKSMAIWPGPAVVSAQSMDCIRLGWKKKEQWFLCLMLYAPQTKEDWEVGAFRKGKKIFTCSGCSRVSLQKIGSLNKYHVNKITINTWRKKAHKIARVLKCTLMCCSD